MKRLLFICICLLGFISMPGVFIGQETAGDRLPPIVSPDSKVNDL